MYNIHKNYTDITVKQQLSKPSRNSPQVEVIDSRGYRMLKTSRRIFRQCSRKRGDLLKDFDVQIKQCGIEWTQMLCQSGKELLRN